MKKILFLFLLFLSFSYSASVYRNYCIDDYYFDDGNFYYHIVGSSSYSSTHSIVTSADILDGYKINDTSCVLDSNATALNLPLSSYNFLMGLSGILVGFSLMIGLILVVRGR